MENITNCNVIKAAEDISSLKFGEHVEFIKEYSSAATVFFAFILAVLIFVHRSVTKCANHVVKSGYQKTESYIQAISLLEFISALRRHNYALLPGIGHLLEKYNGAFSFTLGFYKIVGVTRPFIIEKLLMSPNNGHLHKPKEYDKVAIKYVKETLLTLRAEQWKVHRSVLARAFTYNSLQEQVKIFDEHAKKLVFMIEETLCQKEPEGPNSEMTIGKAIQTHVLQIILHIVTGKSIVGNHVENERVGFLIEKMKKLSLYRGNRPWLMCDLLWFFHPINWKMEKVKTEIELMFLKAFKTAREEVSIDDEDMAGKSLVQLMIKAGFSDAVIFKELFMFILVSNEGIPANMKMLLFQLALNPEIQEKCRMEISNMFGKLHANSNLELNIELLNELNYTEQCILEIVRLYPGLFATGRFLESPLVLDEHTTIAPGTSVYMSAFHLHRDPKFYPEPDKFDPERFSPENVNKRGKFEFIGFNKGPRDCIGKKSAMLEIKTLVSYVLYNFEVSTSDTRQQFEVEMGPNRWPIPDPKIEARRRH